MIQEIQASFRQRFSPNPLLLRAPGRVNLIGEHTDYNEGYVLPAAIDKAIYYAIAPNNSQTVRLFAHDLNETFDFQLSNFSRLPSGWPNYLMGVVAQLQKAGYKVQGFDCAFGGDIPFGGGMSSSAALECGLVYGLSQIFDFQIDRMKMAFLAQKAEHTYAGVQCGIMDQFASLFGKENQVVRLDCRSMAYSYYPFDMSNYLIALCDTGVSHSLASSEYNVRRAQCETGVAIIQKEHSEVKSLRDVNMQMLEAAKDQMEPISFQRCSYVIQENQRVIDACNYLMQNDLQAFGQKMYESHDGLSKTYEVSCKELDLLVDFTRNNADVLGARMMGGGFGGSTINLVKADAIDLFCANMKADYEKITGIPLKIYLAKIMDGVGEVGG